jgi:hypothetical protein
MYVKHNCLEDCFDKRLHYIFYGTGMTYAMPEGICKTPLWEWGRQQCLPFSFRGVINGKAGKHLPYPNFEITVIL